MKTFRYYGNDLRQFVDCDIFATIEDVSITEHPIYKKQRNKRKRMRFKKALKRIGVQTFSRPVFIIEQLEANTI